MCLLSGSYEAKPLDSRMLRAQHSLESELEWRFTMVSALGSGPARTERGPRRHAQRLLTLHCLENGALVVSIHPTTEQPLALVC